VSVTAIDLWLASHPVVRGALYTLLVACAGAWVNWITFKRTEAEWAAYEAAKPRRAAAIRFSRAIFPHLRKIPAIAAFLPAPPSAGDKP
jgi:uncharacterized membrane protein YjjB (DUF3815 family)